MERCSLPSDIVLCGRKDGSRRQSFHSSPPKNITRVPRTSRSKIESTHAFRLPHDPSRARISRVNDKHYIPRYIPRLLARRTSPRARARSTFSRTRWRGAAEGSRAHTNRRHRTRRRDVAARAPSARCGGENDDGRCATARDGASGASDGRTVSELCVKVRRRYPLERQGVRGWVRVGVLYV